MLSNTYIKLLIMAATIYSIRLVPFLFLKKPIKNKWFKSFLYYVPFVTLAVMTFPGMMNDCVNAAAGLIVLGIGLLTAWFVGDLFTVAIASCVAAFVTGLIF